MYNATGSQDDLVSYSTEYFAPSQGSSTRPATYTDYGQQGHGSTQIADPEAQQTFNSAKTPSGNGMPGNYYSLFAVTENQRIRARRVVDLDPTDVALIAMTTVPGALALISYVGPNGQWTEQALNSTSTVAPMWRSIYANLLSSLGMNFAINIYYGVEVLQHVIRGNIHTDKNIKKYLEELRLKDKDLYSRIMSKVSTTGEISLVLVLAGLSALPPVYLTQSTSSDLSKTIPWLLRMIVNGMPMWAKDTSVAFSTALLNGTAAQRMLREPDPFLTAPFRLLRFIFRPTYNIPLSGVRFTNDAIRQRIFVDTYEDKKTLTADREALNEKLLALRSAVCDVLDDANNKIHGIMARGNRDGKLNGIYELMQKSNLRPEDMFKLLLQIMLNGRIPLPLTDKETFVKILCQFIMFGTETASLLGFAALSWPQAQEIRQTVVQWISDYCIYYMSASASDAINQANNSSAAWSPIDFPIFLLTFIMFFYLCSVAALYLGRVVFNALNNSSDSYWQSSSNLTFLKNTGLNLLNRSWGEPLLTPSLPLMQSRVLLLPLLAGLYTFAIWSSGTTLLVNGQYLPESFAAGLYIPSIIGTAIMNASPFHDILGAAFQTFTKVTEKFIHICGIRVPILSDYLAGLKDEINLISYIKKLQAVFKEIHPVKLLYIFKDLIDEAKPDHQAKDGDLSKTSVEIFIRVFLGIPADLKNKNHLSHYLKKIWPEIEMADIKEPSDYPCIDIIDKLVRDLKNLNVRINFLNDNVSNLRKLGVFQDLSSFTRVDISNTEPETTSCFRRLYHRD